MEDILAGVEISVQSLPVEMAEEVIQDNVSFIKSSSQHRDNLKNREVCI